MQRRTFIAASGAAATLPLQTLGRATNATDNRQYLELITYHTRVGEARDRVAEFYRTVALPAYRRLGIGPIGVFTTLFGPNDPSLHVLAPHDTLESAITIQSRLLAEPTYRTEGAAFLDAPLSDPAYVRQERQLMVAFTDMPRVEVPGPEAAESRIFEFRIYESHSVVAGQKKIAMFNEGGEIAIFHKTGLTPVFFGETLFGPRMPNLTYMLTFENMDARDQAWDRFRVDPDWLALRANPIYRDTVSAITDYILRPTPFSEI